MVKSGIQRKIVKGKVKISGGKKVQSKSRIKSSSKSKGFTTTTFEKELQKKVATGDTRAAETLKRFRRSKSGGGRAAQTAADTTKTTVQITDTKAGTRTTRTGRQESAPLKRTKSLRQFKSAKVSGLLGALSQNQRQQVVRAIKLKSQDILPASVRVRFKEIDNQKGTTFLQKEAQKRREAGISSADPKSQGFFRKPTITEVKETLSTVRPSDFKKGTGILGLSNTFTNIRTFNSFLENQRLKAIKGNKNAIASMIGVASLPTNFIESYSDIVIALALLIKDPVQTVVGISKLTKKDIDAAGAAFGTRIQRGEPGAATDIAAELITGRFGLGIIKGAKQAQKLRPSFVKATGETFVIKKTPFNSVKDFLTKPNNPISKVFKRDPEIILKKQTVKTGAKTLSQQARIAGETITAVNAAADQLTSWIKRKQIIRKPIPGESDFPANVKNILKKFDEGTKLSKKDFAFVNKWMKKNVAPNITLLERSLYADPASGLRISRLGIQKVRKATIKDILRGNFKLLGNKPQVLIFQNVKVAKFPKSLKSIETKLKAGKKLTEAETNKLIAWQVKTGSGKFKPVGSTIYKGGIELEVTLAPGEFIKRIKQVGFTFIDGKKVSFVTASVWKPPKTILASIKKAKTGKLSSKQISKLENDLSKKLGRKVKVETPTTKKGKLRRARSDVPVLRIDGRFLRVIKTITRARAKTTRPRPKTRAPLRAKPKAPRTTVKTRAPAKTVRAPAKTVRTPTKTVRGPAKTVRAPVKARSPIKSVRTKSGRAPAKPPKRLRLSFNTQLPRGTNLKFDIKFRERRNRNKPFSAKNNPVVVKKIKAGLPINRAIAKLGRAIDKTTSRSAELVISGTTKQKDISIPSIIKKFKPKKLKDTLKLVEKSKFAIDNKGEKKGLSIGKSLAKKTRPKKKAKKK